MVQIFKSWKHACAVLWPRNLKLFVLAAVKLWIQAWSQIFFHFWVLAAVWLVTAVAYDYLWWQVAHPHTWVIVAGWVVAIVAFHVVTVTFLSLIVLSVHPSVERKDGAYFFRLVPALVGVFFICIFFVLAIFYLSIVFNFKYILLGALLVGANSVEYTIYSMSAITLFFYIDVGRKLKVAWAKTFRFLLYQLPLIIIVFALLWGLFFIGRWLELTRTRGEAWLGYTGLVGVGVQIWYLLSASFIISLLSCVYIRAIYGLGTPLSNVLPIQK